MSESTCKYDNCERDKWKDDANYCIFHSTKVEKKKEEFKRRFAEEYPDGFIINKDDDLINLEGFSFPEFNFFENKKIRKKISFNKVSFLDEVVFTETTFQKEATFRYSNFLDRAIFLDSQFKKKADFSFAKFSETALFARSNFFNSGKFYSAKFLGDASFGGTKFSSMTGKLRETNFEKAKFHDSAHFFQSDFAGKTKFDNAEFSKETLFSDSNFSDKTSFNSVKFSGLINFKLTNFSEDTSFNWTEFLGPAVFTRVTFSGEINFNRAKFSDVTTFEKAKFLNIANFSAAEFLGPIYFGDADINNILNFNHSKFDDYISLKLEACEYINFEDAVNNNVIDLLPEKNTGDNINKINLYNLKNQGNIYIDWEKNNIVNSIENQTKNYKYSSYQYRMLKENFHELGQYEQEDKAYVEFRRNKLLGEKEQILRVLKNRRSWRKIYFINIWKYIKHKLKELAFEKVGLFGTSPKRVASSMGVTVLIFSLFYLLPSLAGIQLVGTDDLPSGILYSNPILKSIYHSLVTFLTIGYGDIHPLNPGGMILSGIEGFLGLFLMSYFTVSFVRKVLR